jgi:hypothetical protein
MTVGFFAQIFASIMESGAIGGLISLSKQIALTFCRASPYKDFVRQIDLEAGIGRLSRKVRLASQISNHQGRTSGKT